MLNKVEVRTDQGDMLSLPLDDISVGYSVQDIEGLDPVPSNMVSSGFAGLDGEQFQSSRREKRNLILTLGLEPDYVTKTARELRNDLYKWFMPNRRNHVNFRFYTDDFPTIDISGRTETFKCPLFVKEPVATISVLCYDPDFYEPIEVEISGMTTPYSISPDEFEYSGTIDTGFVFHMEIDRDVSDFTIWHQLEGQPATSLPVVGDFVTGDVIDISTVPGNKYATLTRGSVLSSILYMVSPQADWMKFYEGINAVRVQTEGAAIPYTIKYTNKHGGL